MRGVGRGRVRGEASSIFIHYIELKSSLIQNSEASITYIQLFFSLNPSIFI